MVAASQVREGHDFLWLVRRSCTTVTHTAHSQLLDSALHIIQAKIDSPLSRIILHRHMPQCIKARYQQGAPLVAGSSKPHCPQSLPVLHRHQSPSCTRTTKQCAQLSSSASDTFSRSWLACSLSSAANSKMFCGQTIKVCAPRLQTSFASRRFHYFQMLLLSF